MFILQVGQKFNENETNAENLKQEQVIKYFRKSCNICRNCPLY